MLGTVGLAGCFDVLPGSGSATKVGRLAVVNWDKDEDHEIDIRLVRDGTFVHEATYAVGEMIGNRAQSVVADCTWDDVAGQYEVGARLVDNSDWQGFDLHEEIAGSPDRLIAAVQYGFASGVPDSNPLNVEVRDRCDEISENYEGGCPAYLPDTN